VWLPCAQWGEADWRWWLRERGWPASEVERYWGWRERLTVRTGRPRDKMGRLLQDRLLPKGWAPTVLYAPTPKQVELHTATATTVLFGGAAGVAKSHGLRWDAHIRCLAVPGYRAILLRRLFVELESTHLDRVRLEAPALGARLVGDEVRYPNESILRFGHCQNPGDEVKYLSTEYDAVYPDELATFERDPILEIMSRVRTTKAGVTGVVRAGSNPGGPHTLWCVDFFMTKTVDREVYPYYRPEDYAYIPGRLEDNPYLMDADGTFATYERRLGMLHPVRRRQLLEGDWSAIEGQFFAEWRASAHVTSREVPASATWVVWMDYGFNRPGVALWAAVLADGRIYVRHELKFQGRNLSDVARDLVRFNRAHGLTVGRVVVDPDLDEHKTGESGIETLRRFGVPAVPGDNARVAGWYRMRHWLSEAPDGEPWLQVHPDCRYTIRTVPTLVASRSDPEDCNSEGDDHAADAIRYGIMDRPAPSRLREPEPQLVPGSAGWLMRHARRLSRVRRRA